MIAASRMRRHSGCTPPAGKVRRVVCTLVIAAVLAMASAGCVDPGSPVTRLARQAGFQEDLVAGSTFRHRVYRRKARAGQSGALHVYIEGDGRPFLEPTTVAFDPTPRDPLMLRLMALDPAPSVYLGRPCYFGLDHDRGCNPAYWTVRRFAPEVVDSLAAALRSEAARSAAPSIELYGHSGGGTLAVLLAARIPAVTRVVTIGANLDTAAWCALHGYSPLLGSLNPAELSLHPDRVRLLHMVGSGDTNTPPALVESAALKTGAIDSVRIVPGYTHNCCWQEIWSGVVSDGADRRDSRQSGSENP
jgi:pimeloyl-ACP methyl ester carboxylesterase